MAVQPLIIRLRNWVGDVTLGVPTLRRLADAGYELRLLGRPWTRDLLAGEGWPVEALQADWRSRVAQLRRLRAEARALDPGFDRRLNAITFPYSLSSAAEMRLAGLRAVGHGFEGRRWLLARSVPRNLRQHEMAGYWELATTLLQTPAPLPPQAQLRLSAAHEAEAQAVRQRLGLRPGYLLLCPFAGGTFEKLDKCWPLFPRLAAEALPPLGRELLLCPGPGDEEDQAARDYPGCRIATGVGLGAYAALLRDAALVIANDTGPGHLAAAVGAPLLSVIGPTDLVRWAARGPGVHIVQGKGGGWPALHTVLQRAQQLLG